VSENSNKLTVLGIAQVDIAPGWAAVRPCLYLLCKPPNELHNFVQLWLSRYSQSHRNLVIE
jgi:hypothetical protein